jgi:hypothetical protein
MRARSSADQDAAALSEALIRAIFDELHPGVRELARNPLLLTILAEVFWSRSDASLPTRRVALFDQAVDAVYNQRKEAWQRAGVSKPADMKAILGAVADTIHTSASGGFVEEGTVRGTLRQQGLSDSQAEEMLHQSRELSGFLVARGQGVYGFLHRSLQEYFVGQHLVREPEQAATNISARLLDPIWREPILLAVGIVSQPDYHGGSQQRQPELLAAMLQAPDPAGEALPRRELLLTAACAECERIVPAAQQHVVQSAHRLLDLYAQREGRGRSETLRHRIRQAFTTLRAGMDSSRAAEAALGELLCDPDFERRFTTVEIIHEMEWYTPAVTRALQRAWKTHPGPAASLLTALEEAQEHLGDDYPTDDLLLRQELEDAPALWERISTHEGWQQVIRGLVLPFAAPLRIAAINRDTPLLEHILAALQQSAAHDALESLQEQLLPLAQQPGSVLARDAALALSWLGDDRWVAACADQAGNDRSQLLPIVASLASARARARARARDLARARARARNLARARARALDSARDLASARALARARASDLASARALDSALALALARIEDIQLHLATAQQYWCGDPEISRHLADAEKTLQHLQQWFQEVSFMPVLQVLLSAIEQWERASSHDMPSEIPETSEQTELQIRREHLVVLLGQLQSANDVRRMHVFRMLRTERSTSDLDRETLETLAQKAHVYAHSNPRIGIQLIEALERIRHNRVDWIQMWIRRLDDGDKEPALSMLLSHIHGITPKVFDVILDELPNASPSVQKLLLSSLSWLARKQRIVRYAGAYAQLLNLGTRSTDTQIRSAIFEVLLYWGNTTETKHLVRALMERLSNGAQVGSMSPLFVPLARLASSQPAFVVQVKEILRSALPNASAAAAALARLLVASSPDAETLLTQLTEHITDSTRCLTALLDAGVDDDIWNGKYHTVLIIAVRLHIEQHPDLPKRLYRRLQRAIERQGWQERRIVLAAIAACAEVMPRTVQEQCGEGLEALLVKGTTDAESFTSRRFALTALSYLPEATRDVVPALLAGCQDVEIVQKDAIEAARRFHIIKGNERALLAELAQALTGESLSTAYAVAHVLGALGTSPVGATAGLREQIITHLVAALDHPNSQREVILYGKSEKDDVSKGELEETLFEVLLKDDVSKGKLEETLFEVLLKVAEL